MAMISEKHYSTTDMFLVSRAVRLFPAYWLTMAFSVVAALWLKTPDVGPLLNLDFWYLVYPMYICHAPVEMVIYALGLQERMSLFTWVAANVLIVVLASALLLLATAPIEKFRLRFKSVG